MFCCQTRQSSCDCRTLIGCRPQWAKASDLTSLCYSFFPRGRKCVFGRHTKGYVMGLMHGSLMKYKITLRKVSSSCSTVCAITCWGQGSCFQSFSLLLSFIFCVTFLPSQYLWTTRIICSHANILQCIIPPAFMPTRNWAFPICSVFASIEKTSVPYDTESSLETKFLWESCQNGM